MEERALNNGQQVVKTQTQATTPSQTSQEASAAIEQARRDRMEGPGAAMTATNNTVSTPAPGGTAQMGQSVSDELRRMQEKYSAASQQARQALTQAQAAQGANAAGIPETPDLRPTLDQWRSAAEQAQANQIDYATQQGINDLQRAQEDAQAGFRAAQEQIAADEARTRDNQALYAEARGDKGGIGAAQYDNVANTAAINRQAVRDQQNKLSTDTWRQISDLRAQGEYQKADAMLQLSQTYLSNLMSLEQWAANYGLSAAQFRESIRQWENDYKAQISELLGAYDGVDTLAARSANRDLDLKAAQLQDQNRQWENEVMLKLADLMGSYGGQETLAARGQRTQTELEAAKLAEAAQEWAAEHKLDLAKVMGSYDGAETLDARNNRASLEMDAAKFAEAVNEWMAGHDLDVAKITGTYNGVPTLDAQKAEQDIALKLAQLMGYYNGAPTLDREKFAADVASVKGQQTTANDIMTVLQGLTGTGGNNVSPSGGGSGGTASRERDLKFYSEYYNNARDAYLRGEITAEEAAQRMEAANRAANQTRGMGDIVTANEDIQNVLNGTLKDGGAAASVPNSGGTSPGSNIRSDSFSKKR